MRTEEAHMPSAAVLCGGFRASRSKGPRASRGLMERAKKKSKAKTNDPDRAITELAIEIRGVVSL